ncbi:MAG: YbjN domain-containing protein [Pseudomonadota bacterium]
MTVMKLIATLALVLVSSSATADTTLLRKDYSQAEIINMLRAEGYNTVRDTTSDNGEKSLEIKVNGITYSMRVFNDGDLLLYFGMTGFDIDVADINDWNRRQRLTRAYLDHENDPILEADLLANAGYSAQQLTEFLAVFVEMSLRYREHLRDVNRGPTTPEEEASDHDQTVVT